MRIHRALLQYNWIQYATRALVHCTYCKVHTALYFVRHCSEPLAHFAALWYKHCSPFTGCAAVHLRCTFWLPHFAVWELYIHGILWDALQRPVYDINCAVFRAFSMMDCVPMCMMGCSAKTVLFTDAHWRKVVTTLLALIFMHCGTYAQCVSSCVQWYGRLQRPLSPVYAVQALPLTHSRVVFVSNSFLISRIRYEQLLISISQICLLLWFIFFVIKLLLNISKHLAFSKRAPHHTEKGSCLLGGNLLFLIIIRGEGLNSQLLLLSVSEKQCSAPHNESQFPFNWSNS